MSADQKLKQQQTNCITAKKTANYWISKNRISTELKTCVSHADCRTLQSSACDT